MSRELLWELSRDSSCFVVRRNGHEFSREALNTMNKNSFKHSAVANCNAVGVKQGSDGKMSLLISCPKKFTSQPCKSVNEIALQKGKKRAVATIKKNLTAGAFRPDLEQDALNRAVALYRSRRLPKPLEKKQRRRRN